MYSRWQVDGSEALRGRSERPETRPNVSQRSSKTPLTGSVTTSACRKIQMYPRRNYDISIRSADGVLHKLGIDRTPSSATRMLVIRREDPPRWNFTMTVVMLTTAVL